MSVTWAVSAAIAVVFVVIFVTRHRRREPSPCPWWLTILLENPYMNRVAGSSLLIRRMGLRPGMRLLDIGCGSGRLTIPAAQRVGMTGEVVAMDIQERMLWKVNQRVKKNDLLNVRLFLGGIGQGVLKEHNEFDRAVLVTVLGEIPDKKKALAEIYDALKPGGILSVTEVLPDPDYQTRKKVQNLAAEAGFKSDGGFGSLLAFTLNFAKPAEPEAQTTLGNPA